MMNMILLTQHMITTILPNTTTIFRLRMRQLLTALTCGIFNRINVTLFTNNLNRFSRYRFNSFIPKVTIRLTINNTRSKVSMVDRATNHIGRLTFTNNLVMNSHTFNRITRTMRLVIILRINRIPIRTIRSMMNIRMTIIRLHHTSSVSNNINNHFGIDIQIINRQMTSHFSPFKRVDILRRRTMRLIKVKIHQIIQRNFRTTRHMFQQRRNLTFLIIFYILHNNNLRIIRTMTKYNTKGIIIRHVPLMEGRLNARRFLPQYPRQINSNNITRYS